MQADDHRRRLGACPDDPPGRVGGEVEGVGARRIVRLRQFPQRQARRIAAERERLFGGAARLAERLDPPEQRGDLAIAFARRRAPGRGGARLVPRGRRRHRGRRGGRGGRNRGGRDFGMCDFGRCDFGFRDLRGRDRCLRRKHGLRGRRVQHRGQAPIGDAQSLQQGLHPLAQVAAVAHDAARPDRQRGNEAEPFAFGKLGDRDRGGRHLRFAVGQRGEQVGVAQPRRRIAEHRRPLGRRNPRGQFVQSAESGADVPPLRARRHAAEDIEQLPELYPRESLPHCGQAQHGAKAVVEVHQCSVAPTSGRRRSHRLAHFVLTNGAGGESGLAGRVAKRDDCVRR